MRGFAIRLQQPSFRPLQPVTVTHAIIPAFCQATPLAGIKEHLTMIQLCLFFSIFLFSVHIAYGQREASESLNQFQVSAESDGTNRFPIGDDINYKGGDKRLWRIISKNLSYPAEALKDSVTGSVYVYFTIDTKGRSTDIKVVKGIRDDLDKEAVRVVEMLDEWIVATQNGRKVATKHMLPIKFSLIKLNKPGKK